MRIVIIAVGRLKSGPERSLLERYEERFASLARAIGVERLQTIELPESASRRPEDRMADEAKAIETALPDNAFILTLDERGKTMPSTGFAALIERERSNGRASLAVILGGPDGLDGGLRQRADLVLSFGAMTLPHQMVRVLLAEQLYRAGTILTGHPYHRG
ncbi:MAG: 23S rRNA (pseudouridine(1915)-N(3))-methyltransferase RlmH [Beijerinckiaceae bacterium]|nr:23S rRNA (pseudouridine(1915)-N(3))-methyltransferase RlmH [Beijerinckiaceae bacterium]